MANEENLIPFDSNQNREEAKKNGKKGGVASGEARRRKRDAQKAAEFILSLPAKGGTVDNLMSLGVDEEDATNLVALMARMYSKAMAKGGDVNAARFLVEVMGGTAKHKVEKERLAIEKERVTLEKKRFEQEQSNKQSSSDAVNDWLEVIMDVNKDTPSTQATEAPNDENK